MSRWIETEMSIWWNVSNIFYKLFYPLRKFFSWAIKVVQYSVVLWKDGEWDHCYFLILMQYKLKRMERFFRSKKCHIVDGEKVAAQIKYVEDLIDKWLDDDFCADLEEAHEKKWGPVVNRFTPIGDGHRGSYFDMWREKSTTPELKEQEKKEQMAIYAQHESAREQCLDEIFLLLRQNVQFWWD